MDSPVQTSPKTVADSYRETADECDRAARALDRQASAKRESAMSYRRLAEKWEDEYLTIEWREVRAGDEISLIVFDTREGLVRERRSVVKVDWPLITLREGDREYDIAGDDEDSVDRKIRRVSEGTRSMPEVL